MVVEIDHITVDGQTIQSGDEFEYIGQNVENAGNTDMKEHNSEWRKYFSTRTEN